MKQLHRVAFASLAGSMVGLGLLAPPRGGVASESMPSRKSSSSPDLPAATDDVVARVGLAEIDAIAPERWAELRARRIYFAHQSVGGNMMRGLERILRARPAIGLAIRRLGMLVGDEADDELRKLDEPGLVHGAAGPNGDPTAKFAAFERFLSGPNGAAVDIAFVKLCYVDIKASTDVDALFAKYVAMVSRIERTQPGVRILHATVPLKWADQGTTGALKRLAGGGTGPSNAARGRYNALLRARYPAGRIIDIAGAESRGLDGAESTARVSGAAWPVLCAEFTSDGGHLNELGQVAVARAMLLTLVENADASGETSHPGDPATGAASPGIPLTPTRGVRQGDDATPGARREGGRPRGS